MAQNNRDSLANSESYKTIYIPAHVLDPDLGESYLTDLNTRRWQLGNVCVSATVHCINPRDKFRRGLTTVVRGVMGHWEDRGMHPGLQIRSEKVMLPGEDKEVYGMFLIGDKAQMLPGDIRRLPNIHSAIVGDVNRALEEEFERPEQLTWPDRSPREAISVVYHLPELTEQPE